MMTPKNTSSDTRTTRMYVDDETDFTEAYKKLKCKSSAEVIRKLLAIYKKMPEMTGSTNEGEIELTISCFVAVPTPSHLPLRKLKFPGDVRCRPNSMYYIPLTQAVWARLREEFFGEDMPDVYQEDNIYDFWHVLILYYNKKENRYLVCEGLHIKLKDDCRYDDLGYGCPDSLLNVWRCDFVDDYADLFAKFSRYAHSENLHAISAVLAENIGDDYDQLTEFFPLRKQ